VRTHNVPGRAERLQSVAIVTTYDWAPAAGPSLARFGFEATAATVELAPYPPLDVAEERNAMLRAERDAALARGASSHGLLTVESFVRTPVYFFF
jgi:hypothetical protein